MYPRQQLNVLALRKAVVQSRIAARRQDCALHAAEVMRPVRWVDEACHVGRTVLARAGELALPVGMLLAQRFAKPGGKLEKVIAYAPLVMRLAQSFRQRPESSRAEEEM